MNTNEQIGCGYCKREDDCKIRDPKINKAKMGCEHFTHHSQGDLNTTAEAFAKFNGALHRSFKDTILSIRCRIYMLNKNDKNFKR